MAGIDFSKFNRGKAQSRVEAPPTSAQGPKSSIFRIQDLPENIIHGYEWTEGTHIGDIVAVEVTNPWNPAVKSGAVQIGDFDYGVEAWVHPANKNVRHTHLCIQRSYGTKDPRCQEYFATWQKGVKGSGNVDHRSSWRRIMVWVPRDPANKTVPGTQAYLIDTPADEKHGFDLIGEARTGGDDGGPVFFWWPTEEGRTVQFEVTRGAFENSWDFKRIKFIKRSAAVAAKLHEQFSFSLDALLIVPTVESMERDIYGAPTDDDEPATTQGTAQAQAPRRDEYKREEADAPRTTDPDLDYSKKPEPGTDKVPKDQVAEASKEDKATGCPHGLTFGKSFLDKPEPKACKTCDKYDSCVDAG